MKAAELLGERQLGEWISVQVARLGVEELASFVIDDETGRTRVWVATEVGLIEYRYRRGSAASNVPGSLEGDIHPWRTVQRVHLTSRLEHHPDDTVQELWTLSVHEPTIQLVRHGADARALLDFARACLSATG